MWDIAVWRILQSDLFSGFWTINQEPDILQTCCFCKKSKKHWHFLAKLKKHISKWIRFCQNPKSLTLGLFKPSQPSQSEVFFKNWDQTFLSWWWEILLGKKIEKADDPEILHCRQMEERIKPNWLDTPCGMMVIVGMPPPPHPY